MKVGYFLDWPLKSDQDLILFLFQYVVSSFVWVQFLVFSSSGNESAVALTVLGT